MLLLLWLIAASFFSTALLVVTLLIALRFINERREQRYNQRKQELTSLLFFLLSSKPTENSTLLPNTKDIDIITHLAMELLPLIQGAEKTRLLSFLEHLPIIEQQKKLLASHSVQKRTSAVMVLSYFHTRESIELLQIALNDPKAEIQLLASRALSSMQQIEMLPVIVARMEGITASPATLADILQGFGAAAFPYLLPLTQTNTTITLKIAIIKIMPAIAGIQAVTPLLTLCQAPSPAIRAEAFAALGKIGDIRAYGVIMHGLKDSAWEVREQAAWCAGQVKAIAALPLLQQLLEDTIWQVSIQAAQALYALDTPGITVLQLIANNRTKASQLAELMLAGLEPVNNPLQEEYGT